MAKFWFYSFHSTTFNQGDRYKAKQTKTSIGKKSNSSLST